ncbi:ribulose bisphosphate carboxylase small subunit, chloroplastic [Ricinus communis]|uniref:Ribulose bisphosphate carboxylase small subunit, chloroplastic n=1 Tax=Ricinus communis TaxID=3988 RepID=B9T1N0_RICCO|nr:ribulose bisphosphate carboxylase small subunit, chloroplastic [Ricinus communis]EEF30223.1 Ribulose bisphosphate carboxylase small chain, chloroplast precursor, putative [Ricinus communis]|eukprot:XP_002532149.1 ribulose bisphosphate carboxylase small chain, chloroplastic [Ricinus communis]
MASSMLSTATVASLNRASPAQASMVAPFTGLKSTSAFPVTRKTNTDITTLANNGGRVQCMQVWPPLGKKKFETLSYLPDLTREQLAKEVEYLLRKGWVPCLEFELEHGFVYRENARSPGYYDGRYWTMWKLPMFGCSDAVQVLKELDEAIKAYPNSFVRIIGFDNVRQVQCISFIAYKPPSFKDA